MMNAAIHYLKDNKLVSFTCRVHKSALLVQNGCTIAILHRVCMGPESRGPRASLGHEGVAWKTTKAPLHIVIGL